MGLRAGWEFIHKEGERLKSIQWLRSDLEVIRKIDEWWKGL